MWNRTTTNGKQEFWYSKEEYDVLKNKLEKISYVCNSVKLSGADPYEIGKNDFCQEIKEILES